MLQTVIIIAGIVIDQLSKFLLVGLLQTPGASVTVIPGVLDLTYVQNFGAGMGILQNMQWLLIPLTIILIIVGIVYLVKHKDAPMIVKITISMFISGGVGNLIDRIIMPGGFVRDFFEFTFVDFYVFNFADVLVTVGAVLLAAYVIWSEFKGNKKEKQTDKELEA